MENIKGLLSMRRVNRILNARVRDMRVIKKGVDEENDESTLQCFDYIEKMRILRLL